MLMACRARLADGHFVYTSGDHGIAQRSACSFERELEITLLGDTAALALGQWKLDGLTEPLGGNSMLVLRKIDGRWVIVHDHSSRLAE